MKPSHALFAVVDLLLLMLTAYMGLAVEGEAGYGRHVMLGVLAAMFTCFVHVVLYMYFVVQAKIIGEAILHHGLDPVFGGRIAGLKRTAFYWSMGGIVAILTASGLGASIDGGGSAQAHGVAAFAAIVIEAVVFYFQFVLIDAYGHLFREAFNE